MTGVSERMVYTCSAEVDDTLIEMSIPGAEHVTYISRYFEIKETISREMGTHNHRMT